MYKHYFTFSPPTEKFFSWKTTFLCYILLLFFFFFVSFLFLCTNVVGYPLADSFATRAIVLIIGHSAESNT